MFKKKIVNLFVWLLLFHNMSYAEPRYYLCGPDEDGCLLDQAQYCACIPLDEDNFSQPYCLDFDNLRCEPLSKVSGCLLTFSDQGRCLATIHQSEPEPPCSVTSLTFCQQN